MKREKELKKLHRSRKIAKIKSIIGYILILGAVVSCHYIVLVVAANSTDEESKKWAQNYLISLAQAMGISPVVRVLLTVVVLKMIKKGHSRRTVKIMKLLLCKMTTRALAMVQSNLVEKARSRRN